MATATAIQLNADVEPQYHRSGGDTSSSSKASQLLQENHTKHDIFFNSSGFHNHIAHHLLSLWALKAGPTEIQKAYDSNVSYQRPSNKPHESRVQDLHDPEKFISYLGPRDHYSDFLQFFVAEIEKDGWQSVLQTYVFARDARAEQMFVRLHGGLLHPIIHLGFGVEFAQPAIIAEALAEAACHEAWIGDFLLPAEKRAAAVPPSDPPKSIVALLEEIRADPVLRASAHWPDENKIRDGVMVRAPENILAIAAQVRVPGGDEAARTRAVAEMTNAVSYYSAGAQRREKMVRFDFFFIHHLNAAIFYPAFLRQTWLRDEDKVRLLEWKIRMDLITYVSRNSPDILIDEIRDHRPKKPSGWEEVERRVCALSSDDGHAVKLVRALANGQDICRPYEGQEGFPLTESDWLQLGHMAIDSVEAPGDTWVRSAGWEEAWNNIPAKL